MAMSSETAKTIVVIAVDKSPAAQQMFDWYVDCLHKKNDSIVYFVHCIEGTNLQAAEGMRLDSREWEKLQKKEQDEKDTIYKIYNEKAEAKQVKVQFSVRYGKPGEAVVNAAKELSASYVVTGTRGMGKIRRTVMGSVSDYIVHHCGCPVIVSRT